MKNCAQQWQESGWTVRLERVLKFSLKKKQIQCLKLLYFKLVAYLMAKNVRAALVGGEIELGAASEAVLVGFLSFFLVFLAIFS